MAYTQDITDDTVFTQLRAFIMDALGTAVTEVVRVPRNRTPMPKFYPFITMSPILKEKIMWPVSGVSDPAVQPQAGSLTAATRYQIQLDAFGATAGDVIQLLHTVLNGPSAFDFFNAQTPAGVYPLYADSPREASIVDEEAESVLRWIMDISLQFNPTLTSTIQTASTVVVNFVNVEASYH
jgi:hypothetical protein